MHQIKIKRHYQLSFKTFMTIISLMLVVPFLFGLLLGMHQHNY